MKKNLINLMGLFLFFVCWPEQCGLGFMAATVDFGDNFLDFFDDGFVGF